MNPRLSRRKFLTATVAAALPVGFGGITAAMAATLKFAPPEPFSWSALVARARAMASRPYQPPYRPAPEIVDQIDYAAHGKIRFKSDRSLFLDGPAVYPVGFFPVGKYFNKAIKMHALEGDTAREILYEPEYFDMPADSPAQRLPEDSGFAGFQIHEAKTRPDWQTHDWAAFLGASYFRAIGALGEYGLSARGVAIDTALPTPEEFPNFTEFYIQPSTDEKLPVVVYALLDGPSISGVFKLTLRRTQGVVIDVENALFMRQAVKRLGIAPLTSMFWFDEYNKGYQLEWRRAAHDSDGLALWTGSGERIWRPLVNPPQIKANAFVDKNPRGFGLMQRHRDPSHYLDRWLNYERRPSCWVEPIGDWGEGAVQLIEIPTDQEDFDNIGCMWVPKDPVVAGQSFEYRYRLHWLADEPYSAANLARALETRIGRGGFPYTRANPPETKRFVVEFGGGALDTLPENQKPEAVITTSRGETSSIFLETTSWNKNWRLQFDVKSEGPDPVNVRAYLKQGDRALTETWLFQLHPQQSG